MYEKLPQKCTSSYYFVSADPADPLCDYLRARRKEDIAFWRMLLPDQAEEEDAFALAISLAPSVGRGEQYVINRFTALWVLDKLPETKAVIEQLWHLDFARLIAIGNTLDIIEEWADIDAALAKYLTPKRAAQVLPSARQIREFIRKHLGAEPSNSLSRDILIEEPAGDRRRVFGVLTSDASAIMMREAVTRTAEQMQISRADALMCMVLGAGAKVTINLYEDKAGVLHTASGHRFDQEEAELIREQANTRTLERPVATKRYRFSEKMRAFIAARDAHCRYPGCSVPHHQCDIDHVLEYNRGGVTSVENAQLLCRHHHNLKTAKLVRARIEESAEVVWAYPNGTQCVTQPEGVLT
ncbi:HNH endonuclease signature motif containing protein [Corynebacterium gerontici]|nr:HNH endonuclease signature motif containing protein [Corynebacterium gerontici]